MTKSSSEHSSSRYSLNDLFPITAVFPSSLSSASSSSSFSGIWIGKANGWSHFKIFEKVLAAFFSLQCKDGLMVSIWKTSIGFKTRHIWIFDNFVHALQLIKSLEPWTGACLWSRSCPQEPDRWMVLPPKTPEDLEKHLNMLLYTLCVVFFLLFLIWVNKSLFLFCEGKLNKRAGTN